MVYLALIRYLIKVALRKESVDRNDVLAVSALLELIVALRKESVDRNQQSRTTAFSMYVALRKESVDRNPYNQVNKGGRS